MSDTESTVYNRVKEPNVYGDKALAQVCRHIRDEFRPFYLQNMRVQVCWTDLPAFLYTFFDAPLGVYTYVPKWIVVVLEQIKKDRFEGYVDVLPLLRMCEQHKDFRYGFGHYDHSLEALFAQNVLEDLVGSGLESIKSEVPGDVMEKLNVWRNHVQLAPTDAAIEIVTVERNITSGKKIRRLWAVHKERDYTDISFAGRYWLTELMELRRR